MTLNDLYDIAIMDPFNMDNMGHILYRYYMDIKYNWAVKIFLSVCLFILPAEEHLTFAHHSFLVEL